MVVINEKLSRGKIMNCINQGIAELRHETSSTARKLVLCFRIQLEAWICLRFLRVRSILCR
jgi:hypothetical protein